MLFDDGPLGDHLVPRESALDPWVIMRIKFSCRDLPFSGSEWQRIMKRGDGLWRFHTKSVPVGNYSRKIYSVVQKNKQNYSFIFGTSLTNSKSRSAFFSCIFFVLCASRFSFVNQAAAKAVVSVGRLCAISRRNSEQRVSNSGWA